METKSTLMHQGLEFTEALIEHDRELDSIYKDVVSLSGRADCLADGLTIVCNGLAEESADKWQLIGTLRCLIEAARTISAELEDTGIDIRRIHAPNWKAGEKSA